MVTHQQLRDSFGAFARAAIKREDWQTLQPLVEAVYEQINELEWQHETLTKELEEYRRDA